jgi:raffinose/stachyose/melibiose transport system permease protein
MQQKRKYNIGKTYSPLFVIPGFTVYALFFLIPVFIGFYYAFTDWNMYLDEISFAGLANFRRMFTHRVTSLAIKNTLIFSMVTTIGKNFFGLLLALALVKTLRSGNIIRTIFFTPSILSYIVIGVLFSSILHPSGLLNDTLSLFGLSNFTRSWLADKDIVMYTVSAVEIWQWTGFHMAIYLAGLLSIPKGLNEACIIDGANAAQRFIHVTIPLIVPTFNVNLVLSLIGGLKVFEQIYILTNGGPGSASQVINTQIFEAFGNGEWGYGTAINLVLFIFITIIALTVLNLLRRKEIEL